MSNAAPRRQLTLFDSTCIIVGIVIGAGIYETTPLIAMNVDSVGQLMLVWVVAGLISLAGALCYVELSTAYPRDGGDYVFLTRAFGRPIGFLFAWAEYWIVRPGNLGMMAFVFARFANELLAGTPLDTSDSPAGFVIYAAGAIGTLTLLNALGVRSGKATQNALTVVKVVGLCAVFVVGMLFSPAPPLESAEATVTAVAEVSDGSAEAPSRSFRLALIFALFTYGGWNDLSYVAAEVKSPERNIFRALLFGLSAIATIYILVNIAFVTALGLEGTRSFTVAGDLLTRSLGPLGGRAISLLVCFSALGAINGTLFAGSRIYYTVGTEHKLLGWLGRWSGQLDSPLRALVLQGTIAVVWVVAFGLGNESGFSNLMAFTSPVFFFFATLVALSLFALRMRDPDVPRPHKAVLYPLMPYAFLLSCLFMLHAGVDYAITKWHERVAAIGWAPEALCTFVVLAAGIAITCFDSGDSGS